MRRILSDQRCNAVYCKAPRAATDVQKVIDEPFQQSTSWFLLWKIKIKHLKAADASKMLRFED